MCGLSSHLVWAQCFPRVGSAVDDPGLQSLGSAVVVHRLGCPLAWGIVLDLASNPCLLWIYHHWAPREAPPVLILAERCFQSGMVIVGLWEWGAVGEGFRGQHGGHLAWTEPR